MTRIALAYLTGVSAAVILWGVAFGAVALAQGDAAAGAHLFDDRLTLSLVAAAFGAQAGLFTYVRLGRRGRRDAAASGAGALASAASVLACCADHLVPVLGASFTLVLVEYRGPLIALGIATDAIAFLVLLGALRPVATARGG